MKVKELMAKLAEIDPEEVIYSFNYCDELAPMEGIEYGFKGNRMRNDEILSKDVWVIS